MSNWTTSNRRWDTVLRHSATMKVRDELLCVYSNHVLLFLTRVSTSVSFFHIVLQSVVFLNISQQESRFCDTQISIIAPMPLIIAYNLTTRAPSVLFQDDLALRIQMTIWPWLSVEMTMTMTHG